MGKRTHCAPTPPSYPPVPSTRAFLPSPPPSLSSSVSSSRSPSRTSSSSSRSSSPPTAVLDASAFPHLVDSIFDASPRESLFALRRIARVLRKRVDTRLMQDVIIHPAGGGPSDVAVSGPEGRLPIFADYEWRFDDEHGDETFSPAPIFDAAADPYHYHPYTDPDAEARLHAAADGAELVDLHAVTDEHGRARQRGLLSLFRNTKHVRLTKPPSGHGMRVDLPPASTAIVLERLESRWFAQRWRIDGAKRCVISVRYDPAQPELPWMFLRAPWCSSAKEVVVVFTPEPGSASGRARSPSRSPTPPNNEQPVSQTGILRDLVYMFMFWSQHADKTSFVGVLDIHPTLLGLARAVTPPPESPGRPGYRPPKTLEERLLDKITELIDFYTEHYRNVLDEHAPSWSKGDILEAARKIRFVSVDKYRADHEDEYALATEWPQPPELEPSDSASPESIGQVVTPPAYVGHHSANPNPQPHYGASSGTGHSHGHDHGHGHGHPHAQGHPHGHGHGHGYGHSPSPFASPAHGNNQTLTFAPTPVHYASLGHAQGGNYAHPGHGHHGYAQHGHGHHGAHHTHHGAHHGHSTHNRHHPYADRQHGRHR